MTVLEFITLAMRYGADTEDKITIGKEGIPIDNIEVDYGENGHWVRIIPRQKEVD